MDTTPCSHCEYTICSLYSLVESYRNHISVLIFFHSEASFIVMFTLHFDRMSTIHFVAQFTFIAWFIPSLLAGERRQVRERPQRP